MAVCPVDLKPCVEDICRSGCLKAGGEPMRERCPGGCGAYVAIDGSDDDDCECEPDEREDWDDEEPTNG